MFVSSIIKAMLPAVQRLRTWGAAVQSIGLVSRVQVRWPSFHVKDNVYDYAYSSLAHVTSSNTWKETAVKPCLISSTEINL